MQISLIKSLTAIISKFLTCLLYGWKPDQAVNTRFYSGTLNIHPARQILMIVFLYGIDGLINSLHSFLTQVIAMHFTIFYCLLCNLNKCFKNSNDFISNEYLAEEYKRISSEHSSNKYKQRYACSPTLNIYSHKNRSFCTTNKIYMYFLLKHILNLPIRTYVVPLLGCIPSFRHM